MTFIPFIIYVKPLWLKLSPTPYLHNAKITILSNICIMYHKYLFILKFMLPISPVFNTSIKYCRISEIVNGPIVNYYYFSKFGGLYFQMTDLFTRLYAIGGSTSCSSHNLHFSSAKSPLTKAFVLLAPYLDQTNTIIRLSFYN